MKHMAPHWNNRIFKHTNEHGTTYALHECYYDEEGKTQGWTDEPECSHYDSPEELITALEQMLNDARRCKDDLLDYAAQPEKPFPSLEELKADPGI